MHDHRNQEDVLTALRKLTRAIDRYSRFLAQTFGMSGTQLAVLREVQAAESLSPGGLAQRLQLAQATVSECVKLLDEKGYLSRTRSETDRRQVFCTLTDSGQDVLRRCPPLPEDHFLSELSLLPDWEQSSLLSALQRIAGIMADAPVPGSSVVASPQGEAPYR